MRTVLLVVAAVMVLSGCATLPPLGLSRNERDNLKVDQVVVSVAPGAKIWWGNAERAFADGKLGQTDTGSGSKTKSTEDRYNEIITSPEAAAYLRQRLTALVKSSVEKAVAPRFLGSRPVTLELTVTSFTIPSAVQRVTLGGKPTMSTKLVLKDSKTGQILGDQDIVAFGQAGNGVLGVLIDQALTDIEDRLVETLAKSIAAWMKGPQD